MMRISLKSRITLVTVLSIVVGGILAIQLGRMTFDRQVHQEVAMLTADAQTVRLERTVDGDALPLPVRRYLEYSGVLENAPAKAVRLTHGGTFRTGPDRPWQPIDGVEYFSARPPAFLWYATLRVAPFVTITARDYYLRGQGRMVVKLASLFPVLEEDGPELTQGALLRYLAEAPIIPSVLLPGGPIAWYPLDSASALAVLTDGDTQVSAVFHFGMEGEVVRVEAERFMTIDGGYELVPWEGRYRNYRAFDGTHIPTQFEASWQLDSGAFTYVRFEVEGYERLPL